MNNSHVKLANLNIDSFGSTEPKQYVLKLFITGATPRSCRAVENLRKFCEKYIAGRYKLEVIDIYQFPEIARQEQIIAVPTLIRKLPVPRKLFLGDLSNLEWVKKELGISS